MKCNCLHFFIKPLLFVRLNGRIARIVRPNHEIRAGRHIDVIFHSIIVICPSSRTNGKKNICKWKLVKILHTKITSFLIKKGCKPLLDPHHCEKHIDLQNANDMANNGLAFWDPFDVT